MRLVFYFPLTARIGHHLREFVQFKSHGAYRKYQYWIPNFFNNKATNVAIFWESSKRPDIYGRLKCLVWMLINGIKPWKVPVLEKLESLNPKNDVLLAFPFLSFDYCSLSPSSVISNYSGLKVFHFSHYFSSTEQVCSVIRKLKNVIIIGEGNLRRNPLYQKYMGDDYQFYILPFVIRERYISISSFSKRKNQCLAAGTKSKVCPGLHKEFFGLFKTDYLHPLRAEIFVKKNEIREFIDCLIYDFCEASDFIPKNHYEKFLQGIKKRIGNDRSRFFSFDIVQKYNEYQMFVSPEEESGLASISFIEGMACGCAYIGRPEFYIDLGMLPGTHFIPYNGSLDDLIKQVKFYRDRPATTAQIAKNGERFVRENFQPQKIATQFWKYLEDHVHSNK